jgi:hypothetical protein
MQTETRPAIARELIEAKRGFDRWRRSRKRQGRIPENLWRMAAEAASIHGVHANASRLRLNSTKLKKRMQTLRQGQASEDRPRFVELPWLGAAPVPECILEAEDQAGRKLRIHLKGEATAQAASLGRMLWTGEE